MEIDNAIFQALGSFGKLWKLKKRGISNRLWKSFGFLFGDIPKCPEMYMT